MWFFRIITFRDNNREIRREFDVNLITTTPGVIYKVHTSKGEILDLQNPSNMPDPSQIEIIEEPWIKSTVITPDEYLGSIIKFARTKGIQTNLSYSGNRAVLSYDLPLNEVVFDFNDRLKSVSSGYASFDYDISGYRGVTCQIRHSRKLRTRRRTCYDYS